MLDRKYYYSKEDEKDGIIMEDTNDIYFTFKVKVFVPKHQCKIEFNTINCNQCVNEWNKIGEKIISIFGEKTKLQFIEIVGGLG